MEKNQASARQLMTKSTRKALPNLGKHLVTKGGLAGVAAGIWVYNGITLYCGTASGGCEEEITLEAQFRQAENAAGGPAGGFFRYSESNGTLVGYGAMLSASYTYDQATERCVVNVEWIGQSTATHKSVGYVGMQTHTGSGGTGCSKTSRLMTTSPNPTGWTVTPARPGVVYPQYMTFYVGSALPAGGLQMTSVGSPFRADGNYTWKSPVYDWGKAIEKPPNSTPGSNDYKATPGESQAVVDEIKADPEYDPDEDGLLNEDDEDDDGDLVEDLEDPSLYDPYDPKP